MANHDQRLPHNVPGDFFVDRACIDCDTCRALAPEVFSRASDIDQSYVSRQPQGADERRRSLMAVIACPVGAIGTLRAEDLAPAVDAFPMPIAPDVYYCGYASEVTFGARSYFIRRPSGNILVDSPRASRPLLRRLQALGGVHTMFLTHQDDVGDHAIFRRELGCQRVLHADDVSPGTADVEQRLTGAAPVSLGDDLVAIPVPGHTAGSTALLFREEYLFTGDHLWWSEKHGRLHASRCVSWHSWDDQVRSLRKLLTYKFRWALPAHGRPFEARDEEHMRVELSRLLASIEATRTPVALRGPGRTPRAPALDAALARPTAR